MRAAGLQAGHDHRPARRPRAEPGLRAFDSGVAGDHFLKKPDGSLYVAPVWPGPSVFPDFTRQASRDWWGGLYKDFVDDGIAGFWNDMNEPAIFETPTKTMPLDTVHRIDGDGFAPRTASHAEVHNVYGMENSRATYEGLLKLRPNVRPFVMTRATFAGGQRYAVTWTGDNSCDLGPSEARGPAAAEPRPVRLTAGRARTSAGSSAAPSPELLTRWYEIGAFTPVFRNHAAKNAPRAEPWVDGPEHLAIRRRFIEERYRLLPYFYAVAEQNCAHRRPGDASGLLRLSGDDEGALRPVDGLHGRPRPARRRRRPSPKSPHAYDVCLPASGWYRLLDRPAGRRRDKPTRHSKSSRTCRRSIACRSSSGAARSCPTSRDAEHVRNAEGTARDRTSIPGQDCRGELYWDDGVSIRGRACARRSAARSARTG